MGLTVLCFSSIYFEGLQGCEQYWGRPKETVVYELNQIPEAQGNEKEVSDFVSLLRIKSWSL